jgi:hypothetical protein
VLCSRKTVANACKLFPPAPSPMIGHPVVGRRERKATAEDPCFGVELGFKLGANATWEACRGYVTDDYCRYRFFRPKCPGIEVVRKLGLQNTSA